MRLRNTTDQPLTLGAHAGVTVAPGQVIDWPDHVAGLTPEPEPEPDPDPQPTPQPARRGKTVPQEA